jgi:outer membrane protein TolC
MKYPLLIPLLACAAIVSPAAAASWDAPFAKALPQEELAKAAIDAFPDVDRAKAELMLAKARSRELDAGPYEFTVNANNADNYPGFTWDVSRGVRLPGKARLDHQAGRLGVSAAEDLVDDARHQTGLMLADAWYAWVQAEADLALDREVEASTKAEVDALQRRIAVKDASQLDMEQAQAALASATARRSLSEGQAQTARLALLRNFPNLPPPARPPVLPEPPALEHPVGEWADITVRSSHEIAIADYQARQAEVEAQRARLDRLPDPTVGIRGIPDPRPGGGYALKGVGVYVAIPFGGSRRQALADSSAARASIAQVNLMRTKRESAALGERNAVSSEATRRAWRSANAAVEASQAAAERTQRGYKLGELDLAQVLMANRQLNEVKRAEISARVDAWRAVTHLRLDSHDLWHDDDQSPTAPAGAAKTG